MEKELKYRIKALADFMFPRGCVVCGRFLDYSEKHLCLFCEADFPLTYSWITPHNRFADSFNEKIQKWVLEHDVTYKEYYAYVSCLFFYQTGNQFSRITQEVKYYGNLELGQILGQRMGEEMATQEHFRDVDLIVPVPLHWTRYFTRGYNQAEHIAKGLARGMGLPLETGLLVRERRTKTQTRVGVEGKMMNVRGAFAVREEVAQKWADVKHVVVVDDVFTTGATTFECWRVLREHFGPSLRISVATLAGVG